MFTQFDGGQVWAVGDDNRPDWKAFHLKPHLVYTFKLSTDPEFVAKLRDVVGLYLDPRGNAMVFCADEKT